MPRPFHIIVDVPESEDIDMRYKLRFSLFFFAMALFNLASNFVHPVTPTLIQDLNLPDYMFGLMLACMQFSNFLFSPFWGKLCGYIPTKRIMLICGMGYAVGQMIFGAFVAAIVAYYVLNIVITAVETMLGLNMDFVFINNVVHEHQLLLLLLIMV